MAITLAPTVAAALAAAPEYRQIDAVLRDRLLRTLLQNNRIAPSVLQITAGEEKASFDRCIPLE